MFLEIPGGQHSFSTLFKSYASTFNIKINKFEDT